MLEGLSETRGWKGKQGPYTLSGGTPCEIFSLLTQITNRMKNTGLVLLQGQLMIILKKPEVSSAYKPFKFLKINMFSSWISFCPQKCPLRLHETPISTKTLHETRCPWRVLIDDVETINAEGARLQVFT